MYNDSNGDDGLLDYRNMDVDTVLRRYDIEMESIELPENIISKMLPTDPLLCEVARSVTNIRFKSVSPTVMRALQMKVSPMDIINNGLVKGMEIVSTLYTRGIYHLPEIIMASKVMEIGIQIAEKQMPEGREMKGTVVMHAAEGDPHDIGKNIAAVMLRSAGYRIVDLGKDAPVDKVVDAVMENSPLLVTGTALMTTTMTAFPRTALILKKNGVEIPYMVAGGAVNREFAESFPTGIYSKKAPNTPPIVEMIRKGYDWERIRDEWDDIVGDV